ncbi:IS3 family transposase [Streptomyces mirabilis]|uniref:IS3 family transposase n=1 Tax=Streptomyces mirabilis TaxID=68239 RepID=UPI002250CB76|nr:IS3 family transposase [Streptomyces mirabilis]MCX4418265.1 IS3 family transposase [Streptomyces mirabilis]MCX4419193.1 IS3 family transposase [Streptomyces mirabilis]MCX4419229.1 IS3 family transposase [Streptomyces mirabilis]MCX4419349.1 IS3 family transposase [Streptomyces mirabilis]MCX4421813.1 IS3 family transposase [Streptomyces mirabilis]
MARPSKYSAEFRSDAIALWQASAGRRTFKDVAADLNVNPETLRTWVRDADGRPASAGASQDTEAELARLRAENARLAKAEKGMAAGAGDPASGSGVFRPGDEVKTAAWDFVSAHAEMFGIKRICRVLEVSRSGYYRWIAGAEARAGRQFEEDALVEEIREIHAEHRGNYGALRVHAELRGFGHTVNRKRVARLMRKHGIVGRHLRKKKRTTIPDRLAPPVADLVQRDFTASTLDEKWCGDITYVQVGAAWLYVACVIDIRSRRVLGWSMAPHMRAELVIDALQAAVATRGGDVTGVIFHADRGSQYTSAAFAQVCDLHGIRRSMGRVGSSYDNALAESFWQGLKRETMHRRVFVTMSQARLEIFRWLTYYNTRRRHSALSYLSPMEFEQHHHRTAKLSLAA